VVAVGEADKVEVAVREAVGVGVRVELKDPVAVAVPLTPVAVGL
jgi:hypothetical protein